MARAAIMRGSTDRRAGTCNHVSARIVGAHDEAKAFCSGGEIVRRLLREADGDERAARCYPHAVCAVRLSSVG